MHATLVGFGLVAYLIAGGQEVREPPPFIFERGAVSQVSETAGVIELREGDGWLRTPGLFSDFTLALEFRLTSSDADAAVFIRTLIAPPRSKDRWGPDSVYRISLPSTAPAGVSAALVAVKGRVRVTSIGRVALKPAAEWQHLQVAANGQEVSVSVNGAQAGVFAVEHFTGHVVVHTTRGAVQLRNVTITPAIERRHDHPAAVARPGADGVRWPKLLQDVKPSYTADAMRRRVEGVVEVEALILPDGSVGAVGVRRSVDPDLDREAVASVWRWKFAPATRGGKPVPVLVPVEVAFTMRK